MKDIMIRFIVGAVVLILSALFIWVGVTYPIVGISFVFVLASIGLGAFILS